MKRGRIGLARIKFDTIIYPYIIWSILQGSVEAALASHTNGGLTFTEVFQFAWEPRAQFWFLYALFSIFLLCSLTFQLRGKLFPYIYITIFVLLYVFKENAPKTFILEFIYSNCIFFVLGIYFYVIKDWFYKYSVLLSINFGIAFVTFQYVFHSIMGQSYESGGTAALFLALTSIAFIVAFSMSISNLTIRLLSLIGESSMSIYLMHILAGSGARIILDKVFGIESVIIHLVVGTLVGIFAPLFAVVIINKFNLKFLLAAPKILSISRRSPSIAL